jgi:hypothetical protein
MRLPWRPNHKRHWGGSVCVRHRTTSDPLRNETEVRRRRFARVEVGQSLMPVSPRMRPVSDERRGWGTVRALAYDVSFAWSRRVRRKLRPAASSTEPTLSPAKLSSHHRVHASVLGFVVASGGMFGGAPGGGRKALRRWRRPRSARPPHGRSRRAPRHARTGRHGARRRPRRAPRCRTRHGGGHGAGRCARPRGRAAFPLRFERRLRFDGGPRVRRGLGALCALHGDGRSLPPRSTL